MGAALLPLAIVAGVAGAGISAIGAINEGQAKSDQYIAQSNIANINAGIAQQNASYASQAGNAEAEQQGLKTKFNLGDIKAIQGASGVDVNTGSAVDVREGASRAGMLDALTIRSNAARAAYGYEVEGAQSTYEGKLDKAAASSAKSAGYTKALGSLLGGASSVASMGQSWQSASGSSLFGGGGGGSSGISDFGDSAFATFA